MFYFHCRI